MAEEFRDITDEVTALMEDPVLGPAIAVRRRQMREADRVAQED